MLIVGETMSVAYLKIHFSIPMRCKWHYCMGLMERMLRGSPLRLEALISFVFFSSSPSGHDDMDTSSQRGLLHNVSTTMRGRAPGRKTSSILLISRILTYKQKINFFSNLGCCSLRFFCCTYL